MHQILIKSLLRDLSELPIWKSVILVRRWLLIHHVISKIVLLCRWCVWRTFWRSELIWLSRCKSRSNRRHYLLVLLLLWLLHLLLYLHHLVARHCLLLLLKHLLSIILNNRFGSIIIGAYLQQINVFIYAVEVIVEFLPDVLGPPEAHQIDLKQQKKTVLVISYEGFDRYTIERL